MNITELFVVDAAASAAVHAIKVFRWGRQWMRDYYCANRRPKH